MAAESALNFGALEAQAAILLETFTRAGYEQVAPSILQPADIFLDQIGEELRSRTYVFTDLAGEELCLRPDLTVPVSRLYLERHPSVDASARYCYNGPAFRFQAGFGAASAPREFRQAGIEYFGEPDRETADIETVLLALQAVNSAGLKSFRLRFGDIGLFYALLDALDLPERWRLKLRHYFWRPPVFHALLGRIGKGARPDGHGAIAELVAALDLGNDEAAEQQVAAHLDIHGLLLAGNRSLSEITARLLDHAADLRADPLPRQVATVIDYYLAVEGPPREAIDRVGLVAKGAGLDLGPALHELARRFEGLEANGVVLADAKFATEFGRDLEYYSGLVFQIESPRDQAPVAGGGRYDGLLARLGAPREVPAVGCAIHTERLLAAVEASP